MAYATSAQLALSVGNLDGYDDDEAAWATTKLDEATDVIDDEIGQSLATATTTVVLDGTGTSELLLPRHPVSAVEAVVVLNRDGTVNAELVYGDDYTWSEAGILTRVGGVWPCYPRAVQGEVTAGYDELLIPVRVRKICMRLAAAGMRNPAGADLEDIGDSRVRWHTPGMELTTGEKNQLAKFRANT